MATTQGLTSVEEQLQQLGNARSLVLADPVYWPQVLHGILPIVSGPVVELRRWGAEFLAETFSTPVIEAGEKLNLAITCLDTMVRLMDEIETGILKSVVQCSASVYPLIFRYMYVHTAHLFLPGYPPPTMVSPPSPSSPTTRRTGAIGLFVSKDLCPTFFLPCLLYFLFCRPSFFV
jgi:hypothetical protein